MSSPINSIRLGTAFLLGAVYATCWWASLLGWYTEAIWLGLPVIGVVLGNAAIIVAALRFLVEHWND